MLKNTNKEEVCGNLLFDIISQGQYALPIGSGNSHLSYQEEWRNKFDIAMLKNTNKEEVCGNLFFYIISQGVYVLPIGSGDSNPSYQEK